LIYLFHNTYYYSNLGYDAVASYLRITYIPVRTVHVRTLNAPTGVTVLEDVKKSFRGENPGRWEG